MKLTLFTLLLCFITPLVSAQLSSNWVDLGPFENPKGIGRTKYITFNPVDSNSIFMVSDCGTLWKSTDDATTWQVFKEVEVDSVFSYIKYDPIDQNVLYAIISQKLYKSTNEGVTWVPLNVLINAATFKLLIDPFNSQNLLLNSSLNGLLKSADGGLTWNTVNSTFYRDLEMNPLNPAVLYGIGASYTVVKSVDNGLNFTSSASIPNGYSLREIAVTAADTNYVYAFFPNLNGYNGQVALSTNGGATFTLQPFTTQMANSLGIDHLEVSQVDKNVLVNGGMECSRSADGGLTWSILNDIHFDHRYLTVNGGSFWSCNDGGIYKSVDGGAHWINKTAGLSIGYFYSLTSSETDSSVFMGGTLDDNVMIHHSNGWMSVNGGDGYNVAIHPTNPLHVFGKHQYYFFKSLDGGITSAYVPFAGITESVYGFLPQYPLLYNVQNPNSLFLLSANVWKSTNNGATATAISNFPTSLQGGGFLYNCKTDSAIIYTKYCRTIDGGATWNATTKNILAVDPDEPNKVWGQNKSGQPFGIFYSIDGANTWTEIPSFDLVISGNVNIRCANNSHDGVYLFSGKNLYYFDNRFSNWQPYSTGLPPVQISDMNVLENVNALRIATMGRGVWQNHLFDSTMSLTLVSDFVTNHHTSVCLDDTVRFYDNSLNNGPVYNATYQWFFPGGIPSTSSDVQPAVVYPTLGLFDVTLIVTNSNGTDTILKSNYVNVDTPSIPNQPTSISGNDTVCQNTTNVYSIAAVAGATSYTWVFPSGWAGAHSSTSISSMYAGSTGGIISVAAKNSCGSSLAQTIPVIVTQPPTQPAVISGSTFICQGSSYTYSVAPVAGATSYTWVLPAGWSGSSATNTITVIPGSTGGMITVKANNNCGSSTIRTLSVTVNSTTPAQPTTIVGITLVCPGSTYIYSTSSVLGASSYTWTLPAGWSGSSTTTSLSGVLAGSNGGNISVSANNGCGSSPAQIISVSINTPPAQPSIISGNNNICVGISQTYSTPAVAGATSYTWTLPAGWSGSSTGSSIGVIPGSNSGIISVVANNSCGSSLAQTMPVTVTLAIPSQPVSISGASPVCQGSLKVYSTPSVAGATSYIWTLPVGWSGSSATNSISVTVGTSSGNISVKAVNTCGVSLARGRFINIISTVPLQPAAISGNIVPCEGSTQTYSIPAVAGAASYTWTLPADWSGISTTNSISVSVGNTNGNISVSANNDCGNSTVQTMAVTVNTVPTQPTLISGNGLVCEGSAQIYSVPVVAGATSYTWTLPAGWSGNSTTNSISVHVWNTNGNISVSANNNCGSSTVQTMAVTVNTVPTQPTLISGNGLVCVGSTQTYSVLAVAGATSYTWTLPAGWSGSSTTNSISVSVGNTNGNISVSANNSCGNSTVQTMAVTVETAPTQPTSISGNGLVCEGSTQTYSVPVVAGATSYTWTLPAGWSGSSTTNSISVSVGNTNGNISVSANNSCGNSTVQTMAVTVETAPTQPTSISGNGLVCEGSTQTYSVPVVAGATSYTWTLPAGWSGSSTTNSISVSVGNTNGNISVSANNSCGNSTVQTMAVTVETAPTQPTSISGNGLVCQGSTQIYSVPVVAGATSYTWTLPAGWSGSSTTNSISVSVGNANGNISVSANNACGNSTVQAMAATVNTVPTQPTSISGNGLVCEGSTQTYSVPAVAGATSYTWTLPAGWSGNSTTNSISVSVGNTNGNISVSANNACGNSTVQAMAATVNTVPTQPTSISGNGLVCEGSTQTYSVPAVAGATSYIWTLPAGWSGGSMTNTLNTLVANNGGFISISASNYCGTSLPLTMLLTVNQTYSSNENYSSCEGNTFYWHGNEYTATGSYIDSLFSITGCDSICTLNLSVEPVYSFNEDHSICQGENYNWRGNDYSTAGIYFSNFNSIHGCDSSFTLNLSVNPGYTFSENHAICKGETYHWQGSDYTSANTYMVNYASIYGCDSVYLLNLTVDSVDLGLTLSGVTILVDSLATSYQWLNCDSGFSPVSGEINQNFTALVNGNYSVLITDSQCADTSACVQITTVGLTNQTTSEISIHPNPVTNELIIELTNNYEIVRFDVLNSAGQVVYKGFVKEKTIVNTAHFSTGLYQIRFENRDQFEVLKFVKE